MEYIVREPICDGFEWLQYNKRLRIIHSIEDDTYQAQSIIRALGSKKRINDWLRNQSTHEFLTGFKRVVPEKPFVSKMNVPNELKGLYVHRLLINDIARWASSEYAIDIYMLLDNFYRLQREKIEMDLKQKVEEKEKEIQERQKEIESEKKKIEEKQKEIETEKKKVEELKSRAVPKGKEKSFVYCIYSEDFPDDIVKTRIHFVRCNRKRANRRLRGVDKKDILFYRDDLPVSMTPNEILKERMREVIPEKELVFERSSGDALINADYISDVIDLIKEFATSL